MKRPHQPDLVPGGGGASTGAEIGHLEALVETRNKELSEAHRQLDHGAAGFHAMVTLVDYMTQEVGRCCIITMCCNICKSYACAIIFICNIYVMYQGGIVVLLPCVVIYVKVMHVL
jgi:hypothetical protein